MVIGPLKTKHFCYFSSSTFQVSEIVLSYFKKSRPFFQKLIEPYLFYKKISLLANYYLTVCNVFYQIVAACLGCEIFANNERAERAYTPVHIPSLWLFSYSVQLLSTTKDETKWLHYVLWTKLSSDRPRLLERRVVALPDTC